ncbi:low affinity iron permease family protein [Agrobacterium tumefaciens]|uniref:low affinity iron permease family protein n=1 Tax=Agrobacterium tumefaciens TaxID=358 RepID=UPI00157347A3|nr:low affinity iron permease family protein [Agrobacterium tumefaciens]WCK04585.1 low affinity iron permease family protein [Agrobacterium tumefaciens]
MNKVFTRFATRIASFSGSPAAFVVALGTVLVWGISGPLFGFSEVWQLVINTGTTIVTFLMIFLVQNSQNRDSAAMEAKLDELLRAVEEARSDFIGIEHLTEQEIEDIRARLERDSGPESGKPSPHHAMARLLSRR